MTIEFIPTPPPKFEDLTEKQLMIRRIFFETATDQVFFSKMVDCDIHIRAKMNDDHPKRIVDVTITVDGVQIIPLADEESCLGCNRLM